MMFSRSALVITLLAAMILFACNKDELTVVSTAPTETHLCGRHVVELNVDSLFNDPPPEPWEPDIVIQVCDCDTLVLHPVNISSDLEFEHWSIDQGQEETEYDNLDLDTITVSSALEMEFDDFPGHARLRIDVEFAPCE